MKFRVHFDFEGTKWTKDVDADTPAEAARTVRQTYKGAIVNKTKKVRSE